MIKNEQTRLSKMLSLALRHKPEILGIHLDSAGWTDVTKLIEAVKKSETSFDQKSLLLIVENNDKKRFEFNADATRIRASQGHSVEVDLAYNECVPPEQLFHGTSSNVLAILLSEGIKKMNRHHVHLSKDITIATKVGQRHGVPAVLTVDTKAMHDQGYKFYQSTNGVWLTEHVPPQYVVLHNE